ncbi:hypothetical protein RhiJN_16524 [Ceratobasidium sp. AG-Ba]|nr:hypothetical protein RhiJN_16524 [Ceratobasidium sp. AG-Ba]
MSSAPEIDHNSDASGTPLPDFTSLNVNTRKTRRKRSKNINRRKKSKEQEPKTQELEHSDSATAPDTPAEPSTDMAGPSVQRKRSATLMTETHLTPPRPTKIQRELTEVIEDNDKMKAKATRRGTRAGDHVKAARKEARAKKHELKCANQARDIIRMLDFLEHGITEVPPDQLTNEEAIDIATGHGVNEGRQEIAVDTTREGERWRKRNNLKVDQFRGKVLSPKQLLEYKFRLFTHGAVWGYRKNDQGQHELVFSVVFHFFDKMSESELDDFAFLGGFFASLQGGPELNTNQFMEGGTMFGLGWRGGTDREFRFGWYARHPDTDWAKHHRDECRIAAIYNRMFLQQSRYIHKLASETINRLRLPRLSDRHLGEEKSELPAANLTCTCQDFINKMHTDDDASDWTFGLWFPTYADGRLVQNAKEVENMTKGGAFVFPNLGMGVDFSKCPGVVSILWQGPHELHGTAQSVTNPEYRRWGTSIQCTNRLTERIERHEAMLQGQLGKDRRPIPPLKINDFYARSGNPRPMAGHQWWVDDMYDAGPGSDSGDEDSDAEAGFLDPDDKLNILLSADQHSSDSDYEQDSVSYGSNSS